MAARNVNSQRVGSVRKDSDGSSEDEVTRLTSSESAKAKYHRINYGDRMPFRQGRVSHFVLLIFC